MIILHIKCLLVKWQKLSMWIKKAWPKLMLFIGLILKAGELAHEGRIFCPAMRTWGQIPRTQVKVMNYSICFWDPCPQGKRQDSDGKIWEPMGYPGMNKVESQSMVERQRQMPKVVFWSHTWAHTPINIHREVFSHKKDINARINSKNIPPTLVLRKQQWIYKY